MKKQLAAVPTRPAKVVIYSEAPLPTERGLFRVVVFREEPSGVEHLAMVMGDPAGEGILARVHSECLTSEVFGSLKCDCRAQLDRALDHVAQNGRGAVVYLRQEGRGIGLGNKIRAYDLQALGHDTVDANRMLGLPDDARRYDAAAHMLRHFDVKSVRLMTNNPEKVRALRALDVTVADRIPVVVPPNPFSAKYLETKRQRMAHELPENRELRAASGDAE
jgi:GTP cyclohydrolase II